MIYQVRGMTEAGDWLWFSIEAASPQAARNMVRRMPGMKRAQVAGATRIEDFKKLTAVSGC